MPPFLTLLTIKTLWLVHVLNVLCLLTDIFTVVATFTILSMVVCSLQWFASCSLRSLVVCCFQWSLHVLYSLWLFADTLTLVASGVPYLLSIVY